MTVIVYFDDLSFTKNEIDVPIDTPMILILDPEDNKFEEKIKVASMYNFRHPFMVNNNTIKKWIKKRKIDLPVKLFNKDSYLCLYNQYNHSYECIYEENKQKVYKFDISDISDISDKETQKRIKDIYFSIENYDKNYKKSSGMKHKNKLCETRIIIEPSTFRYLEKYTKKHKFKIKNGNIEQREISGTFKLEPISKDTIKISINESDTNIGESEKSGYRETVGSFHTHPLDAYRKYNVCLAYPSADDFATTMYIYAKKYGIFHITSTIEGLYIITMKKSFIKNVKREQILDDYEEYEEDILENYGMDYPSCKKYRKNDDKEWKIDVQKFLDFINAKEYFHVQFVDWRDAENKPIKIYYKKIEGNCLCSDGQVKFSKMIL